MHLIVNKITFVQIIHQTDEILYKLLEYSKKVGVNTLTFCLFMYQFHTFLSYLGCLTTYLNKFDVFCLQ